MAMKMTTSKSSKRESEGQRSCRRCLPPVALLVGVALFIGSAILITEYKARFVRSAEDDVVVITDVQDTEFTNCEDESRPHGSEPLPRSIVSPTSDLEMRPLWGYHQKNPKKEMSLLAMAVGIKQKASVNKIVQKFPSSDFVVMLFHYDGVVDKWRDLEWSHRAIHVSALNQTKWWFAKRFLHPDIVAEYAYIFLWDEDLGVEYFHPGRYLSIVKKEGLEISQPALSNRSEVHHHLTRRDHRSEVHRWTEKKIGQKWCDKNSTGPPCTGFVEMMAPVFSKAAWRCTWYMIQNDLVHGWGIDFQLGYCAQGDRSKKIGIVDSEYILHYGLPTLGGSAEKGRSPSDKPAASSKPTASDKPTAPDKPTARTEVRKRSYAELEIFKNRWRKAVKDDPCWTDPYR